MPVASLTQGARVNQSEAQRSLNSVELTPLERRHEELAVDGEARHACLNDSGSRLCGGAGGPSGWV